MEKKCVPCHTVLEYPSGGILVASNAHWFDLSNIDVSVEKLLKVAEENYGKEKMEEMKKDLMNTDRRSQKEKLNGYAKKFVQQSAPGKYSKKFNNIS